MSFGPSNSNPEQLGHDIEVSEREREQEHVPTATLSNSAHAVSATKFWDDEETAKKGNDPRTNIKKDPRECQLRKDDADCESLGNVRTRTQDSCRQHGRRISTYYSSLRVFS
ncbi:uncharacterized protein ARMOST_08351 [Armillaria ostoyae]|uniref:Uncharacterized protein n=1 Tax=Armillaria ostoyae TaxID=47428 RepID=A0A284R8C5_ARMOS|nr:uncharacterized protein ARMOST_08351 [Armillaria ostoyae]